MTARTRCGWVKFRKYGKLLFGMCFPLMLEEIVYMSYVRPETLCWSKVWYMGEIKMGILRSAQRSMVGTLCVLQLRDITRAMDFMLLSGLNETMDQLTMASNVHCYCHVLWREDCRVLIRALQF